MHVSTIHIISISIKPGRFQLTLPPRTSSPMMRQAAVWMDLALLRAAVESSAMADSVGRTAVKLLEGVEAEAAEKPGRADRDDAEIEDEARRSGDVGADT